MYLMYRTGLYVNQTILKNTISSSNPKGSSDRLVLAVNGETFFAWRDTIEETTICQ